MVLRYFRRRLSRDKRLFRRDRARAHHRRMGVETLELRAMLAATDAYGFDTLVIDAFQAGSTLDIDDLVVKDLSTGTVTYENNFNSGSVAGLNLTYWRDINVAPVFDATKTRIVNSRLRLETTGFGQNGSGGYDSRSRMALGLSLPTDFEITFLVYKHQWAGHAQITIAPEQPSLPFGLPSSPLPGGLATNIQGGQINYASVVTTSGETNLSPGSGTSGPYLQTDVRYRLVKQGSSFQIYVQNVLKGSTSSLASLYTTNQPVPVAIEQVTVGDAGNTADDTGFGAVSYGYRIGKYEVTVGQYTEFLNAVAKSDPYGLYNPGMGSNFTVAGISRTGAAGAYQYRVINNGGSSAARPITYVSWFDAARFANWMHNGQGLGGTETGAYTLNGATSGPVPGVNPGAQFYIPTENEWYKAAYYKGGSGNAGYWEYATQSDTIPGNSIGSGTNQANYYAGDYAVTQLAGYSSSQSYTTDVGSFTASQSAYGTFDQSGNVQELTTLSSASELVGRRGGDWASPASFDISAAHSPTIPAWDDGFAIGFRLASPVPNNAPTDIALSSQWVMENLAVGSVVGTLTALGANGSDTFTYSLVSGTGSTNNASFSIVGNQLRTAASFNYESKSSYSIRVRATDAGGLFTEKTFTIGVLDANDAPTFVSVSRTLFAENQAAGTVVATLSTTDVDVGQTFTYALVSGTGSTDNASFSVSGNQLIALSSFDKEAKSSYSILLRTTDSGGLSYDRQVLIMISDVNETPTDIFLAGQAVAENSAVGTTVGTFSTIDPDANSTFTYSLVSGSGSTDNAKFSISGNRLVTAGALDYESQTSHSVRVRATDAGNLYVEKEFVIAVTPVEEPITLTSTSVVENSAVGTSIGQFGVINAAAGTTFIYSLVAGAGSTDNGLFAISGNTLTTAAAFNHETKSLYAIRVRATGSDGSISELAFTISVTDVYEAPPQITSAPLDGAATAVSMPSKITSKRSRYSPGSCARCHCVGV